MLKDYDQPESEVASIQPETLQAAARACHDKLPDHFGFIIIAAPFGDPKGGDTRGDYISNMNREDAIKTLKTVLFRWVVNEEWMKDE